MEKVIRIKLVSQVPQGTTIKDLPIPEGWEEMSNKKKNEYMSDVASTFHNKNIACSADVVKVKEGE